MRPAEMVTNPEEVRHVGSETASRPAHDEARRKASFAVNEGVLSRRPAASAGEAPDLRLPTRSGGRPGG
jgi:hypothetical protein